MKHSVDALRPYARWGSFILSCMTAVCAITFGYYQTDWWLLSLCCAVFFGIMSFSADYGLLFAREAYRKGEASTLTIVMVGWVFVFVLNVVAAVGSVGWQRKGEQHASKAVQQVSLGDQEAVASNAQLIAVTEGNIAEVTKNLTNTTSWSVEVVPTALKASIVSMEGDRVYARSKQCANVTLPESRSFCDKLAGLRGRLANVDAIAGLKDELRRLHEARDRLVAKSQTSFQAEKPSATLEQAGLFASFATGNLKPNESKTEWTARSVGVFVAFGMCIAPILLSWVGWGGQPPDSPREADRTPLDLMDARARLAALERAYPPAHPGAPDPAAPVVNVTTPEPQVIVLQTAQSQAPAQPAPAPTDVVPAPPRRIMWAGDTAFARRVADIVAKNNRVAA